MKISEIMWEVACDVSDDDLRGVCVILEGYPESDHVEALKFFEELFKPENKREQRYRYSAHWLVHISEQLVGEGSPQERRLMACLHTCECARIWRL